MIPYGFTVFKSCDEEQTVNSDVIGIIELLLVFGAAIGVAGFELWSLRRDKSRINKGKSGHRQEMPPD
jgi:hypothetical protein